MFVFDFFTGVCLSNENQVFQTPTDLLLEPSREVNLSLTHHISRYDTILWYQRSAGDASLKLIGYVYYQTATVETPFKGYFKVSGNGEKTAYLHILKPRHSEHSGEYFGAASISTVTNTAVCLYKNLHNAAADKNMPAGNH